MNVIICKRLGALIGLTAITTLSLMATPSPAQNSGRPMPGMGRPPFGGPRPLTLTRLPLSALAAGLRLSGDQQDRIARLRQQARMKRQEAQGPPTPASEKSMASGIMGVLTGSQKQALPGLLQTLRSLRAAGIPLILYGDLKLTPSQSRQIASLAPSAAADGGETARRTARTKVVALLTNTQKELVEESRFAGGPPPFPPGGRPQRPGRGGGPGPGWPGGPPPGGPNGRMGGPPPDGF